MLLIHRVPHSIRMFLLIPSSSAVLSSLSIVVAFSSWMLSWLVLFFALRPQYFFRPRWWCFQDRNFSRNVKS
jgi:hypothetical protein